MASRNKHGECLCEACLEFRRNQHRQKYSSRKAYQAEWRRLNPEKTKAYTKKWLQANVDLRRSIERSWRQRNPEKVKQMDAKAGAKWSKENAGARNAITAKRRAALRKRTPAWANLDAIKRFYIDAAELTKKSGVEHEVDHIVPLQGEGVCGLHVHYNLQILSRSENRRKKNLTATQWGGDANLPLPARMLAPRQMALF